MIKNKKVEIINSRGITLIALVITIIVMLILVAITISMAVNGGLLQYAGKATSDTRTKMEEEKKLAEIESGKDYEYLISKYTGELEALNPSGKIPEGATYTIASSEIVLNPGDDFPATTETGDIFLYGDYEYRYNMYNYSTGWESKASDEPDGWGVRVKREIYMGDNTDKTVYGKVMYSINGIPIVTMRCTFSNCNGLVVSPKIPDSVVNMFNTFNCCTALTTPPVLPNGVKNISGIFCSCFSLITAPEIPQNVTNMTSAFQRCTSLKGTITINANPTQYINCFNYCAQDAEHAIVLTGSSTLLNELKATGYNSGESITVE